MPKTGENIYKRKDGRWEGRYIKSYNSTGKARYGYLYAPTYGEIKIKLNRAVSSMQTGAGTVSVRYLLGEIALGWLGSVKLNCKASTYIKYLNSYNNHIKEPLGKYPISKISGEIIDSFLYLLLEEKKLSRKTVQDICMIVKLIFIYAETNYRIQPMFSFKRLKVKNEQKEVQTLTNDESEMLCRYLLDETDSKKIGVLLCLYTGIRIGELCALKWEDISFDDKTVRISKTVQRLQQSDSSGEKTRLLTTSPKSESSNRIIPLPDSIIKILFSERKSGNCYLLSGNSHCLEPRTMEYCFKKYLSECNLPGVKFHALRHTFATHCIELGIDAKTLSEILGHSSVNITLNRYVHSTISMKRSAMDRLTIPGLQPSEK